MGVGSLVGIDDFVGVVLDGLVGVVGFVVVAGFLVWRMWCWFCLLWFSGVLGLVPFLVFSLVHWRFVGLCHRSGGFRLV